MSYCETVAGPEGLRRPHVIRYRVRTATVRGIPSFRMIPNKSDLSDTI